VRIKGLIPVIAGLMLLVVLGSALAMWYDTLKIQATINTGEVDVEFGTVTPTDEPEAEGKDVGKCYASTLQIGDEGPDDNDLDLNITIENGYPSYWCNVTFEVKNTGTIPVKGPYSDTDGGTFTSGTLDSGVEILYELEPIQIDPGESANFTIKIHILQGAEENHTYTHQVELYFVQWNEAPS